MKGIDQLLTTGHQLRRLYWRIFEPTMLGVRALIVRNDQIMLVRHTYLKGWYLPGGRVERGETALAAVCREVAEECALIVKRAQLSAIYSNIEQNRNDHIALFFIDDFEVGEVSRLHKFEIAEANFFNLNNLPASLTPATNRRLEEYRRQQFDNPYW
ncbi:MAG: NUDIX domain-containing protein [Acidobacteriota bacterium]